VVEPGIEEVSTALPKSRLDKGILEGSQNVSWGQGFGHGRVHNLLFFPLGGNLKGIIFRAILTHAY